MTNKCFSQFCLKCGERGSDVEPLDDNSEKYRVEQYCHKADIQNKYKADIIGYFDECKEFDDLTHRMHWGYFTGKYEIQKSEEIISRIHESFVPDVEFKLPQECPYRLEIVLEDAE